MVKTHEELKASGLVGDELAKFFAEGTLTVGELAAFIAKFPQSKDWLVLVNDETCPSLMVDADENGRGRMQLLTKSEYLSRSDD